MCTTFMNTLPSISLLIGKENAEMLDEHNQLYSGAPSTEKVRHFKSCRLGEICCRYISDQHRTELEAIDLALGLISNALCENTVRSAYSDKLRNDEQFFQTLAEIAVAASCANNDSLKELEWESGEGKKDIDVLGQVLDKEVRLEVTVRTDKWIERNFEYEPVCDENDEPIDGARMVSRMRDSFTKSEREVLEENEIELASIGDDAADPAHPAIKDVLLQKAKKFPESGQNIIVICTYFGDPDELDVLAALSGPELLRYSSSEFSKLHPILPDSLMLSDAFRRISGVILLRPLNLLRKISRGSDLREQDKPILFSMTGATSPLDDQMSQRIISLFSGSKVVPVGPTGMQVYYI